MKVYFNPSYSKYNEYIDCISTALIKNGVQVLSYNNKCKALEPIQSIFYSLRYGRNFAMHFNWIENKVNNDSVKSIICFALIRVWIGIMMLRGSKICWTMHNKFPHSVGGQDRLAVSFYKYMLKRCHMVLVHCKESEEILINEYHYKGKIVNVPHGNYIKSNNGKEYVPEYKQQKPLSFMYFGAITPYKNVLMLISVFKDILREEPNASLGIYGRCKDENLLKQINDEIAGNAAISFSNAYISDHKLQEAYNKHEFVILPYDKSSMLNSGSAIMTLSQGRGLIISEFGYIKDIKDKDFVKSYNYTDEKNHRDALYNCILNVIKEIKQDAAYSERLGKKAFLFAKNELDWVENARKIMEGYE